MWRPSVYIQREHLVTGQLAALLELREGQLFPMVEEGEREKKYIWSSRLGISQRREKRRPWGSKLNFFPSLPLLYCTFGLLTYALRTYVSSVLLPTYSTVCTYEVHTVCSLSVPASRRYSYMFVCTVCTVCTWYYCRAVHKTRA